MEMGLFSTNESPWPGGSRSNSPRGPSRRRRPFCFSSSRTRPPRTATPWARSSPPRRT